MLSNATTIAINSGSNEGSSVSIEKQSVKIAAEIKDCDFNPED